MKRLLGMIGLLFPILLLGCSGSLQSAKYARDVESGKLGAAPEPSEYCKSLDAQRDTAGLIAKLLAGGATASAASVAYWESQAADMRAAFSAAGLSAASLPVFWYAEIKGEKWVKFCQ